MSCLELSAIVQAYGDQRVLDHLSLSLESGAIACLLGPSGCGKTTALRCIAGFEPIAAGSIRLDGELLAGPGTHRPPETRQIGVVFQDYALFPHLSVAGNVGFGLSGATPALRAARDARVADLLDTVGLRQAASQYPHELSGGQQQRVALARALAPRPRLLLLDEPFSNLDVALRERLALEVRDILRAEGTTALMVTHDQQEAFGLADQVGVLVAGRIEQWATPETLYHRPATRFVANFVGRGAFLPGRRDAAGLVQTALGPLAGVGLALQDDERDERPGLPLTVLLRPDDLVVDAHSPVRATVTARSFRGAEVLHTLRLAGGDELLLILPSRQAFALGDELGVRVAAAELVAFAA